MRDPRRKLAKNIIAQILYIVLVVEPLANYAQAGLTDLPILGAGPAVASANQSAAEAKRAVDELGSAVTGTKREVDNTKKKLDQVEDQLQSVVQALTDGQAATVVDHKGNKDKVIVIPDKNLDAIAKAIQSRGADTGGPAPAPVTRAVDAAGGSAGSLARVQQEAKKVVGEIMSKDPDELFVVKVSRTPGNRIIFEKCPVMGRDLKCETMGDSQGYTEHELEGLAAKLKDDAKRAALSSFINGAVSNFNSFVVMPVIILAVLGIAGTLAAPEVAVGAGAVVAVEAAESATAAGVAEGVAAEGAAAAEIAAAEGTAARTAAATVAKASGTKAAADLGAAGGIVAVLQQIIKQHGIKAVLTHKWTWVLGFAATFAPSLINGGKDAIASDDGIIKTGKRINRLLDIDLWDGKNGVYFKCLEPEESLGKFGNDLQRLITQLH